MYLFLESQQLYWRFFYLKVHMLFIDKLSLTSLYFLSTGLVSVLPVQLDWGLVFILLYFTWAHILLKLHLLLMNVMQYLNYYQVDGGSTILKHVILKQLHLVFRLVFGRYIRQQELKHFYGALELHWVNYHHILLQELQVQQARLMKR